MVDDEPVNQHVLANHLAFGQYDVTGVLDGDAALDALARGKPFDLILLDIMMPKMSGYEVCRRIRKTFLSSELPVIMVTAKNEVVDLLEGLSSGANDYLAKPFSKDELLARIKTHLNLLKINSAYGRFVPHEFLRFLGKVRVKGKKESVAVYEIYDGDPEEMAVLKYRTAGDFDRGLEHYFAREFAESVVCFKNVLKANPDDKTAKLYLQRAARFVVENVPDDWQGVEAVGGES